MASKKRAIAELTADDRGLQRGVKRAESRISSLTKLTSKSFKSLGGVASGVIGGLSGGLFVGGALFALEAAKTLEFEKALTRLGINSRGTIGNLDTFRQKVFNVSTATGVARDEILSAAARFTDLTGDGKAAAEAMGLFARVSRGSGTTMEDVSASAAALQQNMKIDPAEFEKAFSILIAGGKAGAVTMKEFAGLMASLTPFAANFAGGTGVQGLADLQAALQLSKQGFGSASEAATGLEALMGSIVRGSRKFKKGGVDVFTTDEKGKQHLKGFQEIIEAIAGSKLAKDPTLLVKAFGSKEAYQAYLQLTKVDGAWDALATSTLTAKDVAEDYAAFQASAAGRIEASMNGLKNAVAAAFTPERIEQFAAALAVAVGWAGTLITNLGNLAAAIDRFVGPSDVPLAASPAVTAANKGVRASVPLERQEEKLGPMEFGPLWKRADDWGIPEWLTGNDQRLFSDKQNTELHRTPEERAALTPPVTVLVKPSPEFETKVQTRLDNSRGHAQR